jgi:ligand-binding sensor domain-containing protein
MKKIVCALMFLLFISGTNGFCFEFLKGLVVNYGDFSYISSIAVGYQYAYFGTTNGIIRYDISNDRWGDPMTGIEGLRGRDIKAITASRDDQNVWVRTDQGIFEYTEVFDRWDGVDQIPNDELTNGRHLRPDPSYFPPPGFNYLNTGVIVDEFGRQFPLTDIVDDGWSHLWIGTWGMGAFRADNTSRLMQPLPYGLIQQDISTIYSNHGVLWMGGEPGNSPRTGLTIFDWRKNSFAYGESQATFIFQAEKVNDIFPDRKNVYVATDNGIWDIDKKNLQIKNHLYHSSGLPDNQVFSVYAGNDTLFAGTNSGLGIIYLGKENSLPPARTILASLAILTLDYIDGDLWMGTSQGAFRLTVSNGKVSRLTVPQVTQTGPVYDIKHTADKVWLATYDNLVAIDRHTADALDYSEINNYGGARAIAVTDTLVAAATPQGLLLFFVASAPRHYLYTVSDGLISNNIKDLVIDGDYIWLGTDRGLTRFWYMDPALNN